MWKNLAVGVLTVPTLSIGAATFAQRTAFLRNAANALRTYRDQKIAASADLKWADADSRPSMILVAPEYMYVGQGFELRYRNDLKSNRFMEEHEKDGILADLQQLSATFGKQMVMAPGSIAHRKALPAVGAVGHAAAVNAAKTQIRTAANYLHNSHPTGNPATDPTKRRYAGKLQGFKPLTAHERTKELDFATQNNLAYHVGSNEMFLFHNGRIIAQYAKRAGFHERLPLAVGHNTVFVPGIKAARATVGGINFGAEICFDHALGVLRGTDAATGTLPKVHLICSAHVGNNTANVQVRDGGYLLHSSSHSDSTTVERKQNGTYNDVTDATTVVVNGCDMKTAVIELDI